MNSNALLSNQDNVLFIEGSSLSLSLSLTLKLSMYNANTRIIVLGIFPTRRTSAEIPLITNLKLIKFLFLTINSLR